MFSSNYSGAFMRTEVLSASRGETQARWLRGSQVSGLMDAIMEKMVAVVGAARDPPERLPKAA